MTLSSSYCPSQLPLLCSALGKRSMLILQILLLLLLLLLLVLPLLPLLLFLVLYLLFCYCWWLLCFTKLLSFSSVSVSAQDGIVALALRPVSQQSPQGCPRNSASICLVEHSSFSALEGGMSAASFLHSSFLHAINAVMLWPVHVQKVPQASEHLCPAKLKTRCDICCACQSICPFIPTDSGVPRTVDKNSTKEKVHYN